MAQGLTVGLIGLTIACGRVGYDPLDRSSDAGVLLCPVECELAPTRQPSCVCLVPRTWLEALSHCEATGFTLLRIDNATQNAEIESLGNNFWLGASDSEAEGQWIWTDGDPFWTGDADGAAVGGLYNNWEATKPNNASGAENCCEFELEGFWDDTECEKIKSFVCEPVRDL